MKRYCRMQKGFLPATHEAGRQDGHRVLQRRSNGSADAVWPLVTVRQRAKLASQAAIFFWANNALTRAAAKSLSAAEIPKMSP